MELEDNRTDALDCSCRNTNPLKTFHCAATVEDTRHLHLPDWIGYSREIDFVAALFFIYFFSGTDAFP